MASPETADPGRTRHLLDPELDRLTRAVSPATGMRSPAWPRCALAAGKAPFGLAREPRGTVRRHLARDDRQHQEKYYVSAGLIIVDGSMFLNPGLPGYRGGAPGYFDGWTIVVYRHGQSTDPSAAHPRPRSSRSSSARLSSLTSRCRATRICRRGDARPKAGRKVGLEHEPRHRLVLSRERVQRLLDRIPIASKRSRSGPCARSSGSSAVQEELHGARSPPRPPPWSRPTERRTEGRQPRSGSRPPSAGGARNPDLGRERASAVADRGRRSVDLEQRQRPRRRLATRARHTR